MAVFQQSARALAAVASFADAPPIDSEHLYALTLQPQETVNFKAPPSKKMLSDGAYAGVLRLRVPETGVYRVAIDSAFWLDVIRDGKPVVSVDFNGSKECAGPHKIVIYPLPGNSDLLLQLSAAGEPKVRLSVTLVPATTP